MAEANAKKATGSNNNAIIIAVTIVALAVVFMYFLDRQQKRELQLEQLEAQMGVWEEWPPPRQNRRMNNTTSQGGGKIL